MKHRIRLLDDVFPGSWEDGAIVSGMKQNKDKSLTVNVEIWVNGDNGNSWRTLRTVRLEKDRESPQ